MQISLESLRQHAALWLRQGVSPRRLALSLALGCAVGCIPLVGIPTLLCAALALALGLNLPAIQAANYAVMPLQFLLIVPFVRLGRRLFPLGRHTGQPTAALLHVSALHPVVQLGSLAVQAMFAWLLIAGPAVVLLTYTLTPLLRRIPVLSQSEAGD